ncbi:Transcriptional regulator, contains HTH domain [Halanaeroarchaeum sp. HSR-CO]|uniref:helix-turn-helix domain-containing protein n=1 Tax=Halanaeroarchaeum sp. HSR-CO TaxID=2866382 RepID=UPI00217E8114|nr:helix-turn-helix domain-containing protein [Halanaeroarchaeum sp. HSR-CO]UWG48521.1 Transcriptional regulator, contains HTH domain [Halanaeroarchaeum sp. HSR-CO]
MNVIVELSIPSHEFELGRILTMEGDTNIVLETLVPLGGRSVPFFRVQGARESFESAVSEHRTVSDIQVVSANGEETIYALDWDASDDAFFGGIMATKATILEARGIERNWRFELRFPSHDALSTFQDYCIDHGIAIEVLGLYNPTDPDAGPWYGLTTMQRTALSRAVEAGYYSIPREISTQELAAEFDISDQAMTERLRRAIINLVENTLLLSER